MACFSFYVFLFAITSLVVFGQDSVLNYSVSEEVPSGTPIGNVGQDSNLRATASAEDYSHIRYSFLHQGHSYQALFSINSLNGSIYTKSVLDRENIVECEYSLTCVLSLSVVAQSKISAFFRKIKINITVLDINDNAPSFEKDLIVLEISELATVGSEIAIVGAVDADAGNNTLQKYYILNPDNRDLPFATSFENFVDGTSVVKLEVIGSLDRETQDHYNLTVVAEDNGDPQLTGTIVVDIAITDSNDNSPVFTQSPYNVTVEETVEVGTEILRLTATDADLGINSEISYSLSKNQLGKIHEFFVVNETTGALCVKKAFTNAAQYRIIVEATDHGLQPLMAQGIVVIHVLDSNNNPPEININLFSETGIAKISEYADIGTAVAHIALIDKDTGINGVIQCDLTSDHDVFTLQGFDVNEYKVTVAKGLDRETREFVYVIINCHDKGTPPLNSYVEFSVQIIDENDHSPKFLQEIYFVDVYENNEIDTELVQVSAIDDDIGKNGEIQYSAWATGKYQFYIDALSGFIKTMSTFDREDNDRITLYAYAKDAGSPPRTSTATVILNILDVNDNDPVFSAPLFIFNVSENVAPGTSVGTITVSDDDLDKNGQLSVIIDAALPFTIDSSGVIKTVRQLDREDKEKFSFLVTAHDYGVPSRNSTASAVVHVTDVNDNYPVFVFPDVANYTIALPADTKPTTVVAKIKAFDLDERTDNQSYLFFSILNTNVSTVFTIDGYTGEITLTRPIADSDQEIFTIDLRVDDNGNPKLHNTTSLRIFIERVETPKRPNDTDSENKLIAIILGCVTFVLVFTIGLVIVILRKKTRRNKDDDGNDQDRFYDKPQAEKRVQFVDIPPKRQEENGPTMKATDESSKMTFSCDTAILRDHDLELESTGDKAIKENKQAVTSRKSPPLQLPKLENKKSSSGSLESRHSTSGSVTRHSTPRSDSQLSALQSHSSLLQTQLKPHASFSMYCHEDNHSQTSAETTTSDSGRGGSESDLHSTSLSHSHDSEIRPFSRPLHSTKTELSKPWMNLADLQYSCSTHSSVAKQLHDDRRHRLQFKTVPDRHNIKRNLYTQSHSNFDRSKFVTFQEPQLFPPPPSDLDRSFMTYEEEDDDASTTTSGSYTIDHEDVTLDIRSPGLRGCLV